MYKGYHVPSAFPNFLAFIPACHLICSYRLQQQEFARIAAVTEVMTLPERFGTARHVHAVFASNAGTFLQYILHE